MQTICVSRGSYRRGKELAERLSDKLGCSCLSREEIVEAATRKGIPVGKVEEAVVKRLPLSEPLSLLIEHYKAFVTVALAQRILKDTVVYHGRAGHLMLPGVPHVLRVRAITDPEDRIEGAAQRLRLPRARAQRYIEQVDDDVRRWIRTLYNLDLDDPQLFNFTVNCSKVAVDNVATALVSLARLPEFEATPGSLRRVENLYLAARCRLALAEDERTRDLSVQVRAEDGSVSVTYLPWQPAAAEAIPLVLQHVDGVRDLHRTVALTSILWVQERFDPGSETFQHVADVAQRWNAAVDLVRFVPGEGGDEAVPSAPAPPAPQVQAIELTSADGGILDDGQQAAGDGDDGGVGATLDRLIKLGRAGAQCTVAGGEGCLIGNVCHSTNVSLVVVDNLFLSKGPAVRKRMMRDLAGTITERMRAPVISAEELKEKFAFGPRQWLTLAAFVVATAALYVLALTNQEALLMFLRAPGSLNRALAVAGVLLAAPVVAYLWGTAAHYLLRLARLD
jgi:hypothetical protein